MESKKRIRKLIQAIDARLRCKSVDLASGVSILCNGYQPEPAGEYTSGAAEGSGVRVASIDRLGVILDKANQTTGCADATVTAAVQRLCDGYAEDVLLYSFGAISDLHIQYATGLDDFQRALTYLKDRVPFTCVCGDLVSFASAENMAQYKEYVGAYAGGMTMYECAGNHETFPELGVGDVLDEALWKETTGKEPYYSFEHEGDVFLFLGINRHANSADLFPEGGLEWLEEALEANKDRRCFVFQHIPESADACADPSGRYDATLMGSHGQAFVALMKRYTNAVWFHGHTHLTFGAEQYPVSESRGYRSVHIPSLSSLRFYDEESNAVVDYYYDENNNKIWGSSLAEGYIVDVYDSRIVLRGIDFAAGDDMDEVAVIAEEVYVLDTTLV